MSHSFLYTLFIKSKECGRMKTWYQLFTRHGFNVTEVTTNRIDLSDETAHNTDYLLHVLKQLGINHEKEHNDLFLYQAPVTEDCLIEMLDFPTRGKTEACGYKKGETAIKIDEIDTYIAGLVRQFNRLDLFTTFSCDGHDKNPATIYFELSIDMAVVERLLKALSIKYRIRNHRVRFLLPRHVMNRRDILLTYAEKLSQLEPSFLTLSLDDMQQFLMDQTLEQLLKVDGASGYEYKIRELVAEKLIPYVDHLTYDDYGNLLAQKTYGNNSGPTLLLNAHLDVVESFSGSRQIMKHGNVWTSTDGILGADDRSGVAILLRLAEMLYTKSFNGTIKFIFTINEEVGLLGAKHVPDLFLWDVDAGIVLDRRGNRDIITGYGQEQFCHQAYGKYFVETASKLGMFDWSCQGGGSSDTRIWSEHGIPSVNLSVGYNYEHTEAEQVDTFAMQQTLQLVTQVVLNTVQLQRVLRERNKQGKNQKVLRYVTKNEQAMIIY